MKPERILLQRRLYDEARKRPAGDRRAFLDQACGEDRQLREDLENLLGMATSPGSEGGTDGVPPTVKGEDSVLDGFLSPPGRPGSLGRVGRYEVEEIVGQGSFGVVMRARDQTLLRLVAIKTLQHTADAATRRRFLREARAIAAVPNADYVIRIHEVGEDPAPFLVMEYIQGPTLQQKLDQNGPLGQKEVLRIGQQIALGLAAAHKAGLVHRDIKPANILLENHVERVKITDFGLACATTDATLTQPTRIKGTPDYMSPEQVKGKTVDHRSDLFSLGSVLYAMVTGQPPFRTGSLQATLSLVATCKHRPVRLANREISDRLCEIIERLLRKDPRERYQSAGEVAERLEAELSRLQAPPINSATGVDLKIRTDDDASDSFGSGETPARWWPILLALAAIAAIAIGASRWEALTGRLARTTPRDATGAPGMTSGETRAAHPTLAAAATPEIATPELDSTDRRVAEWVIRQGGAVILHGREGEIDDPEKLPAGRFSLQWVYFRRKPVGDDGLGRLHPLREIQGIDAISTGITDAGLKHIAEKTGLLYLFIGDNAITDRGLEHLRGLSRLQMLGLHDTGVSDPGMLIVANLRNLGYLYLSRTQVSDAGLARLTGLKGLQQIRLDETKVTANGIRAFRARVAGCEIVGDPGRVDSSRVGIRQGDPEREVAEWVLGRGGSVIVHEAPGEISDRDKLPTGRFSLQWVYFKNRPVDLEGFRKLKSLRMLQGIEANATGLTDEGLKHIGEIRGLFYLFIEDNPISDEGVEHLSGLRKLQNLYLSDTGITDRAMRTVGAFSELGDLYLSRTKIGDVGLTRLNGLTKLTEIRLVETNVSAAGIDRFKAAVPGCKVVADTPAVGNSPRVGIRAVDTDREVAEWVLKRGGTVRIHEGPDDIADTEHLPKSRFSVQWVYFKNRPVDLEGFKKLKGLRILQGIEANSTGLTNEGLKHIGEIKGLFYLFISDNPVSDEGVEHLAGLRKLQMLYLSDTGVTDRAMATIETFADLGYLYLSRTKVGDAGLARLAGLKGLKEIRLDETKVSADGLSRFKQAVPACKVEEGALANASSGRSSTPPAVADQREIADWVFENGGSVVIHEGKPGDEIMAPKDLPRGRFTIQVINFRDRRIGDDGVRKIKQLPRLQGLGVSSMGITDRGMADIGEMNDLVWLFLDRNPITDEGLRSLQGLKSLGLLSVQYTEITDKGMRFIRDHRNLGNLFLAETSITDDGLALLSGLKNLQRVRLRGTRVTADGIRKFEKQLPNCVVDTTTN